MDLKLEELVFSSSTKAEICMQCVDNFEDYDKHCMKAAQIQDEMAKKFKINQDSKKVIKCDSCQSQFLSYDEVNSHECVLIDDDQEFDMVEQLEVEDYQETIEQATECQSPKEGFENVFYRYTCGKCKEKFEKKRDYEMHSKHVHLPENAELTACLQCSLMCSSAMECKLHVAVAHPTSSSFECPVCSRAFKTRALLNRHFGIHSAHSERPHACEICGKNFFHYSSFQAHIKIHADIREFSCVLCSKTFRSQSHLNRHLKIHTKQKDHKCPSKYQRIIFRSIFNLKLVSACGICFAERYNLTAHMCIHRGITRRKLSR